MKIVNVKKNEANVILSTDEIHFLNNTINETFEALDEWEFSIRTGFSIEEARQLQDAIGKIADSMRTAA